MTRILFVDDEIRILDGLRRMLWKHRDRWSMHFAAGPAAAVTALGQGPFDILITDMRMAEMDGATLLERAMVESPATVRIVLSGQTEAGASERAAGVAHRFLSKPCDPTELATTIELIETYRQLVPDRSIQAALGRMSTVPTLPSVYEALEQVLGDSPSLPIVSRLVRSDPGLTAGVLHLVSSSFFGRARESVNPDVALGSVGFGRLRSVVMGMRDVNATVVRDGGSALRLESERRHAQVTAAVARAIAPASVDVDSAWAAGLLHDVGKLLACICLPNGLGSTIAEARAADASPADLEAMRGGPTHASVGGYLLGLWGLRPDVVAAVVHHHEPMHAPPAYATLAATVHVADVLAHYVAASADGDGPLPALDDAAVVRIGGEAVLESGRRAAILASADGRRTASPSRPTQCA
jgi:HD-like signal output (HDOD) protein